MSDAGADAGLRADLARWGDRTSSALTAYPHYVDFPLPTGRIRHQPGPRAWVAATEPLCPPADRAAAFAAFAAAARAAGRRAVMMPVGARLAGACRAAGFRTLCLGAEPVLELAFWLGEDGGPAPEERLPLARALARRGGRVERWSADSLGPERAAALAAVLDRWRAARPGPAVGFLNTVDPLRDLEHKALFVLLDGRSEGPVAFLTAVPVDGGRAWFFADYPRDPEARAGAVELLMIEAARALRAQGAAEVRLGLCPLAHLRSGGPPDGWAEAVLRPLLARHHVEARWPFSYAAVTAFKTKLEPSRWDPLFLVVDGARGPALALDLAWAHFPAGPFAARTHPLRARLGAELGMGVRARLRPVPAGPGDAAWAGAGTLLAVSGLAALHAARGPWPAVEALAAASRYVPGAPRPAGVWLGPLFHNHLYHLGGDLLSFLVFGLLVEWAAGRWLWALVVAFGLWATNPLSALLVTPALARWRPEALPAFLAESDVGSSNAVYALVGAAAAGLRRPWLLLLPFAANGIYLCVGRGSWLSVHHLLGLAGGWALGALWLRLRAPRA